MKVKDVIKEDFSSENPLSFRDRLEYDWKSFKEMFPQFTYEIRGEHKPYVIEITNSDTGEIRVISAIDYDGSIVITYRVDGKEISSLDIDGYIVKEMA